MVLNTRKNIRRKGGDSSTKDKTRRRTSSARRSVAKKRWNKIRKQTRKLGRSLRERKVRSRIAKKSPADVQAFKNYIKEEWSRVEKRNPSPAELYSLEDELEKRGYKFVLEQRQKQEARKNRLPNK